MTSGESVDTAIRNGIVVSSTGMTRRDLFVIDGKIVQITAADSQLQADREIDAAGRLVLPGIIDAHVHPVYADRIETLSKAAASMGITTLIPYIGAVKAWGESERLLDAIESFIAEGEERSLVDFSVHCTMLQDDVNDADKTIPALIDRGIVSFKAFMAYAKRGMKLEDDQLLYIMKIIAANNGLLAVHAENGDILEYLEGEFTRQGNQTPEYFPPSHPNLSEAEAIFRLLTLASVTHCPVYIPHISTAESLAVVELFKEWDVVEFYVETCPHYLTLTDEQLTRRGALAKMSPPLRKEADTEAIWHALGKGLIDVVASDSAGNMAEKNEPLWDDIFQAPNGIPGVETLFQIIYEEGVNKGRITLPQLVASMCENPARIFGLYPRKGVLEVGSDADIVVFDPASCNTVPARNDLLNVDYTLYEGWECMGAPVLVMQRGITIMENGGLRAAPGLGGFVPGKTGGIV